MGNEEKKGISRRSFLTGAATTGALAAVGSLVGCGSPAADTAGEAVATTGYSWEVAPAAIADSEIVSTVETDILVIGAGLSGCATACSAAEKGGNVTVVEKTASYVGRGGGFGALNSRYMEACGAVVDKVNAKAHWMAQCSSRVNEDLIVKFFNNSEVAANWFLDKADAVKAMVMVGAFYSHDDVYAEQPGYHMVFGGEGMESQQFVGAELLYKDAVKAGATFVFSSPAEQLTTDESGAVTGCICKTEAGYVKYVAKNTGLCTGDIGGNREMCEAYAPICIPYGFDRSQYMPAGVNTGDGH
ncbi:MAG: FAD-binding protein, partial [Actinobacteria bacterium]|nr:FAD-binding protein [Actinomycetota bacterium]